MFTVSNLQVDFDGTPILRGVSFEAVSGDSIGIIGPNGSGKTTLFNALSGFVNHHQGQIILNGIDISKLPPYTRAKFGLGRVFQNYGIFRDMTLLENMIIALEARQKNSNDSLRQRDSQDAKGGKFWGIKKLLGYSARKALRVEALQYLGMVKLEGKIDEKASCLSGGQMRLLEIIRTLAFGSELFLLDEPTAGVSPKMKIDVADIIKHLQSMGKTTLIIEHDINFVQSFCKKIIVLDQGSILLSDTPENIRNNDVLHEIYFGRG